MITSALRDVIHKTLAEVLEGARIVDLRLADRFGHNGDPVLEIFVIYELAGGQLDPERTIEFVPRLFTNAEAAGVEIPAYPMKRFISFEDWKASNPAAA